MRLNETAIKAIPAPARGYTLTWDDQLRGLALRTTSSGVRSFIFNYRTADGTQRRATLGRWPVLTASAARYEARKLAATVASGGDPLGSKRERRAAENLAEAVEQFADRHLSQKRSGAETARYLRRYAVPVFGNRKLPDIKRRDIVALVESRGKETPIAANRLLSALSRLFNWASAAT